MFKVTVLYNLPESDREDDVDTQKSAKNIAETLRADILGIKADEIGKLYYLKTDLVFNLIEWTGIRIDAAVKAIEMLEEMRMPYTGSNAWGYRLSSDKLFMKKAMEKFGIPMPVWQIFETGREKIKQFSYPVIIKPVYEHCGIGVTQSSVCKNNQETRNKIQNMITEYKQPVLAEEFIDGRELHVTVLEKKGKPWILPPAEVVFAKKKGFAPILTYEGKWEEKSDEYKLTDMQLASLSPGLRKKVEEIANVCYLKLDGRDYPRLDMRVRDGEVFVLEINNNPGLDFDLDSGIGVSARAAGFKTYEELLRHIVNNAMYRWEGQYDAFAL